MSAQTGSMCRVVYYASGESMCRVVYYASGDLDIWTLLNPNHTQLGSIDMRKLILEHLYMSIWNRQGQR